MLRSLLVSTLAGLLSVFAAAPAGTNYKLESYGVGSGGTSNSTSSSYALEGISGEVSGTQMSGTTYRAGAGLIPTQLAKVDTSRLLSIISIYFTRYTGKFKPLPGMLARALRLQTTRQIAFFTALTQPETNKHE